MLPLIELRGAMIYAAVAEMPFFPSLLCCVIGNILPVPFLIKFAKTVLIYFAKIPKIIVKITAKIKSAEKQFPNIFSASSFFPCPIEIAARGAPPAPAIEAKALISIKSGRQRPTPVNALVPTTGICPI